MRPQASRRRPTRRIRRSRSTLGRWSTTSPSPAGPGCRSPRGFSECDRAGAGSDEDAGRRWSGCCAARVESHEPAGAAFHPRCARVEAADRRRNEQPWLRPSPRTRWAAGWRANCTCPCAYAAGYRRARSPAWDQRAALLGRGRTGRGEQNQRLPELAGSRHISQRRPVRFRRNAVPMPDSGDIRADLVQFLVALVAACSTPLGRALLQALGTARNHADVQQTVNDVFERRSSVLRYRLDKALDRGELQMWTLTSSLRCSRVLSICVSAAR